MHPLNHGHETDNHRLGKRILAQFWQRWGYSCFCEECNADVVAIRVRDGRWRIVASEYERSVRNAHRNVSRNFRAGAHVVLVAVPDERLRVALRRKLQRELPRALWTRVGVVILSAFAARLEASP